MRTVICDRCKKAIQNGSQSKITYIKSFLKTADFYLCNDCTKALTSFILESPKNIDR